MFDLVDGRVNFCASAYQPNQCAAKAGMPTMQEGIIFINTTKKDK